MQVSSPALAVLAALRWLAEGGAAFAAAALQKQQEAAAVGAGEGWGFCQGFAAGHEGCRRPNCTLGDLPVFCQSTPAMLQAPALPTVEMLLVGQLGRLHSHWHGGTEVSCTSRVSSGLIRQCVPDPL